MNVLMCEYLDVNTVFQVGSHYYAKNFQQDKYDVNWINQPTPYLFKRNIEFEEVSSGYKVFNPKVIMPFCKYPPFNTKFWANNYLNEFSRTFNKRLDVNQTDILWMTNVKMLKLADTIKHNFMIHRMADDFSGFSGAYKNMIYLQNEVIKKSDLVLVSAKNLIDKANKFNKNVIYLPNGVDTSRFENIEYSLPKEYSNINGPKVIYVGALEDWFDYSLILNSAITLKEVSFILIGNVSETAKNMFKEQENIFLLGKKAHDELPNYLYYADIGIMPFIENKLTHSIHPLKVYEYFAAGLPVVSRELEEVKEMNSPALLYKNEEEFVSLIKELLVTSKRTEVYKEYASNNTWEKRYIQLKEYMSEIR
ncbi:glycosyltransferase [Peribacillus sp. NPDC101481]|uniref:glycosyltransferase n=1 Tax=Peribacillus sp. NPDC101481 TaxID=3364403 RepID=UPI00380CC279